MTIKRVNSDASLIKAGQFVCFEPMVTEYVASRPCKVVGVAGSRVYYRDYQDEYDAGYKAVKSVVFVCDTKEEGMTLFRLNEQRFTENRDMEKAFKAKWIAKIDDIVANSQKGVDA